MPMNDKTIKIPQVNQTEEVTYQSPYAAVTTIRVLALNPKTKQWDAAALDDCISPQIKNGGKLDRRPLGSKLLLLRQCHLFPWGNIYKNKVKIQAI